LKWSLDGGFLAKVLTTGDAVVDIFIENGEHFIIATNSNKVYLFNLSQKKMIKILKKKNHISFMALSKRHIAIVSVKDKIQIFDHKKYAPVSEYPLLIILNGYLIRGVYI